MPRDGVEASFGLVGGEREVSVDTSVTVCELKEVLSLDRI